MSLEPLPATTSALILDPQPGLYLAAQSRPHEQLLGNLVALARVLRLFAVPTVVSTSATNVFGGPVLAPVSDALGGPAPVERTVIDAWQVPQVRDAVLAGDPETVLLAGVFTEACVLFPALGAVAEGRRVIVVADACAGIDPEGHRTALDRMQQAGVVTVTWLSLLLQWQGSWLGRDTYDEATSILRDHVPSYGLGLAQAAWLRTASPARTAP